MNNVLVIDSSPANVDTLQKFLSKNGYYVISMLDGSGVNKKIELSHPDLIIINCDLQKKSGYDVCKTIRENGGDAFVPVLMMGVAETAQAQIKALAAGADDFISIDDASSVMLSKVKSLIRIKNLSDQLKRQYTALAERDKLLDLQLKMARHVQRSLIKERDFVQNGVHFISKYLPAMDIGGDFYDVLRLDDDCVGVAIGDVSGHGISASLLTAMLNMMIKNLAPRYFNPAQFLFHMNNEFCNIFEDSGNQMFACVFYAVINTRKKRIYYSNAGQPLPLLVKRADEKVNNLESYGMPVGMMSNSVYEHKMAIIDEGDLVLFYTDGLSDNLFKNKDDEFSEKIAQLLLETNSSVPPDEIIKMLVNEFYADTIDSNVKYEMDDVSLIVCKI